MKKNFASHVVSITVFLLIVLFVYTGAVKILEVEKFKFVLSQSPAINPGAASILSYGVPLLELFLACLLMVLQLRYFGLVGSFILLMLFTLYVGYMLLSGEKLPCGCGGVIAGMSWTQHLLFNATFWALSGISILLYTKTEDFIAINRVSRKPV